jgi:hypothetical protein
MQVERVAHLLFTYLPPNLTAESAQLRVSARSRELSLKLKSYAAARWRSELTRASFGMPSYKKILTAKEVKAIRSYIISRTQETAKPTQASQRR